MDERIIANITGNDGPIFLALCSLHGNEPSGEAAIRSVAAAIEKDPSAFSGRFIGMIGNLRAREENVRFIDEDLNRIWTEAALEQALLSEPRTVEQAERRALLNAFVDCVQETDKQQVFVLDLHSTSSESPPFIAGRTEALPAPHLKAVDDLKLPELVHSSGSIIGTFHSYLSATGYSVVVIEGGAHTNLESALMNEAAIWSLLGSLGQISESSPEIERSRMRLKRAVEGVPARVQIFMDHPIAESDRFRMRPGFRNFQPISEGDHLADDVRGAVRVTTGGYLLFPLYQQQGDSGFYVAQAVTE